MSKPKKHNRKGPKSTRGGCLYCKPWKYENSPLKDRQKHSVTVAMDQGMLDEFLLWERASLEDLAKFEMELA